MAASYVSNRILKDLSGVIKYCILIMELDVHQINGELKTL